MNNENLIKSKYKNKNLISNKTSYKHNLRYKLKYYSPQKDLPPINQNNDIMSKIKKSTLKKSVSYLYKSLFPDEKKSMEDFLNNFSYDKYLEKPNWKYTYSPFKDEEKIKQDLMMKNTVMKYYNKMKKPSKIKKEIKKKPRMVQIIEDNCEYKNRLYDFWEDNFCLSNRNKNSNKKEDYNENNENNKGDIYNNINGFNTNRSRNKMNFSKIYRGNLSPFIRNKIYLSPIK